MRLVLAAAIAKLAQLKTTRCGLLVLRRRVVPLLALSALQCDDFAHRKNPFRITRCQVSK